MVKKSLKIEGSRNRFYAYIMENMVLSDILYVQCTVYHVYDTTN